jgi:hypothetical protein
MGPSFLTLASCPSTLPLGILILSSLLARVRGSCGGARLGMSSPAEHRCRLLDGS